jgi:WD40 repeat protein
MLTVKRVVRIGIYALLAGATGYALTRWLAIAAERNRGLQYKAQPVESVAFSPDGKLLAVAHRRHIDRGLNIGPYRLFRSNLGCVAVWNIDSRRPIFTVTELEPWCPVAVFAPVKPQLLVGLERQVAFHDIPSGELSSKLPAEARLLALSVDGNLLATAGSKDLELWDLNTTKAALDIKLLNRRSTIKQIRLSPDSNMVAAALDEGSVVMWSTETGAAITSVSASLEALEDLDFSPDGALLAAAGRDGVLTVWNTASWDQQTTLSIAGESPVVCFLPNGSHVLSIVIGPKLCCWSTSDWNLEWEGDINGTSGVTDMAVSAKGDVIAVGTVEGRVQLFDIEP